MSRSFKSNNFGSWYGGKEKIERWFNRKYRKRVRRANKVKLRKVVTGYSDDFNPACIRPEWWICSGHCYWGDKELIQYYNRLHEKPYGEKYDSIDQLWWKLFGK